MAPHWKCGSGQPVAGSNPALSAIAVPLVPRAGKAAFPALCTPHGASGPDDAAVSCLKFRRGAQQGPGWQETHPSIDPGATLDDHKAGMPTRVTASAALFGASPPGERTSARSATRHASQAWHRSSFRRVQHLASPRRIRAPNARFAGARGYVARSAARRRARSRAPAPGTEPRAADRPPRARLRSPPRAIRDRLDPPC